MLAGGCRTLQQLISLLTFVRGNGGLDDMVLATLSSVYQSLTHRVRVAGIQHWRVGRRGYRHASGRSRSSLGRRRRCCSAT